jgi:hypothetical protein
MAGHAPRSLGPLVTRVALVMLGALVTFGAGCQQIAGIQDVRLVPVTPDDPGASDVSFTLDQTANVHAISPYIYGKGFLDTAQVRQTLTYLGGSAFSAYDWETNASNPGRTFGADSYANGNYFGVGEAPGAPIEKAVTAAHAQGASAIVTVPMAGWVAADASGVCTTTPPPTDAQIAQRFQPIVPRKGAPFAYPPDRADGKVYADEMVAFLESTFPSAQADPARRLFYALDDEPELWFDTHAEMHPARATYAELATKSVALASAIKDAAPHALVLGPVSYGWNGYTSLQDAPDAGGHDFLDFYLDTMRAAEATKGRRLLDVLDLHWFSEAKGGGTTATDGTRITGDDVDVAIADARMQAPRSLWDATYREKSWIVQDSLGEPIRLLPRLFAKIAAHYPGTQLSFSEYDYGAAGDVSGGVAVADVLGIFGRYGVFAAAAWPNSADRSYLYGAFAMFRSYDGAGATFGDTSFQAATSDDAKSSVYASSFADGREEIVVVAINKTRGKLTAGIRIRRVGKLHEGAVYVLTSAGALPVAAPSIGAVGANAFRYEMPPTSVSTLVFRP